MSNGSPAGYLFGKFIHHRGALAPTIRPASPSAPFNPAGVTLRTVAEYTRTDGLFPYRVVHDTTANPPYGRFIVYVGAKRIGSGISFPGVDDCRRMESPPAPTRHAPIHLDKTLRRVLGALTADEKAEQQAKRKVWNAKLKARRGEALGQAGS